MDPGKVHHLQNLFVWSGFPTRQEEVEQGEPVFFRDFRLKSQPGTLQVDKT